MSPIDGTTMEKSGYLIFFKYLLQNCKTLWIKFVIQVQFGEVGAKSDYQQHVISDSLASLKSDVKIR